VTVLLGPREEVNLGRTALDGDHLAAQVVELGDPGRVAALNDDRGAGSEVVDEVGGPGSLGGVRHGRHGQVQAAAGDVVAQPGEVDVGELDPNTQNDPDLGAEVGLHADYGAAVGPERRHGCVGGVGADPQDAPAPDRGGEQVVQPLVGARRVRRGRNRLPGRAAGRGKGSRQCQDQACREAEGT